MKENIKSLIKQELYEAIAYFIERQDLAAQAMLDLGLDLEEVGKYGALAWVSSATRTLKDAEKPLDLFIEGSELYNVAKRAEALGVPQVGFWKDYDHNEWKYFLHGGGCRLTNTETGEPIEWNCPNKLSFTPWFFCFHLEWQLDSPERKNKLLHTRNWIQEIQPRDSDWINIMTQIEALIGEMIDDGLINEDRTLAALE
jgi:hypothetical protein